jgi:hypothetical protein
MAPAPLVLLIGNPPSLLSCNRKPVGSRSLYETTPARLRGPGSSGCGHVWRAWRYTQPRGAGGAPGVPPASLAGAKRPRHRGTTCSADAATTGWRSSGQSALARARSDAMTLT